MKGKLPIYEYLLAEMISQDPIYILQRPNSWTYNFIEVSSRNLESSQTLGFSMDFLNSMEGGIALYQIFVLSPSQKLQEVAWVWRNKNLKAKRCRWLWITRRKTLKVFTGFSPRIRPQDEPIIWYQRSRAGGLFADYITNQWAGRFNILQVTHKTWIK